MFRVLYTLCDVLAAVSAIISPVAIFHWLLRIVHVPAAMAAVDKLNPLFDPLNALVESVVKAPPLQYAGHAYSTTQGVLACLFTVLFFVLNFASESLKASEQRMDVSRQSDQQRRRLQKLREEHQTSQKQTAQNSKIYVQVQYDSHACLTGAGYLESAFVKNGGKMLQGYADSLSLGFDTIGQALQYCMDASQSLLSYYATLRPVDPQPPFQIAVHAVSGELPVVEGIAMTRNLVRYGGPNQVLFSQDIKSLLEAQGLGMSYRYQSVGLYGIGGTQPTELFRLFFTKPTSSL
jgi:hypothetical protein